jgi:inhibitor of KinA
MALGEQTMKWIRYGPNAWLLQFAEQLGDEAFARGRAIAAELERHPPPGLMEFVPAFTTVLLEFDPAALPGPGNVESLREELTDRFVAALQHPPPLSPIRDLPVYYDGPDLDRVAKAHGISTQEVVRLHSAPVYKVYMLGFSPGFPYLGELDPRLHTPRLSSPRPTVPAGSVAIGGEHTGIYSVDSPGGWNIIGRTTAKLFDRTRVRRGDGVRPEEMFLLKAGDRVRFVPRTIAS